ncbi:hypothetical protein [Photobacterium satsumensis]|uniref:hypothetical protein n=1 Tax=Photobacterium satsumensis TaxID=2910239 RepID=UPI003D153120
MSQSIYGIDLAKHSFSIHGEDHQGKVLIHKTITRSKVLSSFANIPPAIVVMEACGAVTREQAILFLHRARENWIHERTALLNQIRAILATNLLTSEYETL